MSGNVQRGPPGRITVWRANRGRGELQYSPPRRRGEEAPEVSSPRSDCSAFAAGEGVESGTEKELKIAMRKIGMICLFAAVALPGGSIAQRSHLEGAKTTTANNACSAPEYRQFDFWIGDWDAFDADNPDKAVARNQVDSILGGCVLREDYQGTSGAEGRSFSIYDASRKVWHQTWVTNRGVLLVIEGSYQNGEMVLSGADPARGGQIVRGIWKPVEGGVRETAALSADGGKTWKPWFDITFRPHKR